jgi:hypothetical protein
MRREICWSLLAALAWVSAQACATYDALPMGTDADDDGGSSGRPNDGGASSSAGNASAGGVTCAGKPASSNAGGSTGGAASEGDAGAAGASEDRGAGGAGGDGASGEATGGAAMSGSAGSGGDGGTDCASTAPEASCSCVAYGGHDYWFCTNYLTFGGAENKCKAVSMHLPKIDSEAEDDWLFSTAAIKTMGEYFLGATDASTPDEWSWLAGGKLWSGVADGTPTGYANFSPNEPNDSGDCLVVQSNGPWDDRICTDQRKYVCEEAP